MKTKNSKKLAPQPVSKSFVEMNEIVLPSHTNQLGSIFGGQIMSWVDIAAAISAGRHARRTCVTASIDSLHFVAPVKLGQVVCIYASVNYAGRTSMEVGVRIESENRQTLSRTHVASSYLTFVALDEKGVPTEVPQVLPETADQKRRYQKAILRKEMRLKLKEKMKK